MMAEMEDSKVSEAHLINHKGQPLRYNVEEQRMPFDTYLCIPPYDPPFRDILSISSSGRVSRLTMSAYDVLGLSFMAITSTSEVSQTNWWTVQIKSDEVF